MKVNILVGARFQAKLLADLFQRRDTNCKIYTSSPKKKWKNDKLEGKKHIVFVPLVFKIISVLFGFKNKRAFKEFDAIFFDYLASIFMRKSEVLHGWATFTLFSAKKFKKNKGIFILERACPHVMYQEKILIEEYNKTGIEYQPLSNRFIERSIAEYELADKIIVPSRYSYNSFIREGISPNKLEIVHLDANFNTSILLNNEQNKIFTIGCVGGNPLRKGFIYLIDAWQSLNLKDAKLLIKTSLSELKNVKIIWDKIKNDESINIIEYQENMQDFYSQCDITCLSSIDDGFGMVVFESLACGRPVIASENVGAAEFIVNGETGYVFKNRDVSGIESCIYKLYSDTNLLNIMKVNSINFYKKYKSGNNNYESQMTDVYLRLGIKI